MGKWKGGRKWRIRGSEEWEGNGETGRKQKKREKFKKMELMRGKYKYHKNTLLLSYNLSYLTPC